MSYSHRGTPNTRIQEGAAQPPPSQPAIPQTILVECNRGTAPSVGSGLNNDPATWTNNFDGGIQLKAGDAISINSATLNSIGVGDLINFTLTNENGTQDNKATWIHSFYVVNDGKNNKRASCNMDGSTYGALGEFRFDTTNNDCDLYRWTNTGYEIDDTTRSVSYYQDKFMPLRVANTEVPLTPVIDYLSIGQESLLIQIYTDNIESSFGGQAGNFTYFSVNSVAADGTVGAIENLFTKNIFQIGRTYQMQPVGIEALDNPNQYLDNTMYAVFGIVDIVQNVGNNKLNAPDGYYVKTTPLTPLILSNDGERQSVQTKSVSFLQINGSVNFGADYGYVPAFYNWEDTLMNLGDDVYSISYDLINPADDLDTEVRPNISNGSQATGKVVVSNVLKYKIDIEQMPSDSGQGLFPVQSYNNNFIFKLNGVSFSSIADMVTANQNIKQFGIRIYTADGYKYAMIYLGQNNDTSTIVNNNTITLDATGGSYFIPNVNEFPTVDSGNIKNPETLPVPLDSVENPHEILFIGNLAQEVKIRFYNDLKQDFIGNFNEIENYKNPGTVTTEAYWMKQPITAATNVFRDDFTSVFPVNIEGYTGGLVRSFNYFQHDGVTKSLIFNNNFEYVKHYEHFSFEIDAQWNSPSDIATKLTDQTHTVDKARDSSGNVIPNSAGIGIPHNRLCIPVWTTDNATESQLVSNTNLVEGSFKLVDTYTNVSRTPPFTHNNSAPVDFSGDVDIFFRTKNTCINYPSPHTNDATTNPPYNDITTEMPCDFNQGAALMGSADYIRFAKTFTRDLTTGNDTVSGYPVTYIKNQAAYVSQLAGANDVSFGWDDNISRFSIGDLHVGIFTIFDVDEDQGGQDEVKIYVPAVNYKKNQTRGGGIYVENWYSIEPTIGMGLKKIIDDLKLTFNFSFGTIADEWFLTANNTDIIGERFWNKLGFDESQIGEGGEFRRKSTNNELDTATAIATSVEPAANRPSYTQLGNFVKTDDTSASTATVAGYQFSSVGNLNMNNHAVGMSGVQNTQGSPIVFVPHVASTQGFTVNEFGKSTGVPGTYVDSEAQYNPDREMNKYYTISTQSDMSTSLDAKNLPTKTKFSYFYVLTDLVESNFYASKFGGAPINCIGTINKLNSDNDFYFSYSSPQRIYATRDRVVTSITTSIRNTDFSSPALISEFSSVIYQIDRFNPVPEKIPPSISVQQEEFFNNLNLLVNNIMEEKKVKPTEQLVEEVLEELYVGGMPTENVDEIVNDIATEVGVLTKGGQYPIPQLLPGRGEELPEPEQARINEIYDAFLAGRDPTQRVTKREFIEFLEKTDTSPEQAQEALAAWRQLQSAQVGARQSERAGFPVYQEQSRIRPRRGQLNPEEARTLPKDLPAYIAPPMDDDDEE